MYVRFKPSVSRARLQVSLVETKRTGSSVAAIHIAGLGSVPGWWDAHDRFAFWTELAPRLAELEEAGILGPEDRAKVIASIDGRLPLPRRAEADAIASGFLMRDVQEQSAAGTLPADLMPDALAARRAQRELSGEPRSAEDLATDQWVREMYELQVDKLRFLILGPTGVERSAGYAALQEHDRDTGDQVA